MKMKLQVLLVPLLFTLSCSHFNSDQSSELPTVKISEQSKNPMAKQLMGNVLRSDYSPKEIYGLCEVALKKLNERLDKEVKTAMQLDQVITDFNDEVNPLAFMAYVHNNKAIRDEGRECEEKYNKALIDVFTRRSLYDAVKSTKPNNSAEKRLVAELKRLFLQNGMALSDADLELYKKLKTELSVKETAFAKNLGEDNTLVHFTDSELKGLPKDFLSRMKKSKDGKRIVTTKSTDFIAVMENASLPETRKKMLEAYDSRAGKENVPLLEEAILLRQKLAKLLGYSTWADYRLDGRMAKNSKNVLTMLADEKSGLKVRLKKRLNADLDLMLKAKRELENPQAQQLEAWDLRYFPNQIKKRSYTLDTEELRQYFPKDKVMAGMFQIYSQIFGVKFSEVEGAKVWDKNVKLYSVRDSATDDILAYFFTDFIPREGKYGHAAAFQLITGRMLSGNFYSQPVSAIVANFTPPTKDKPSLFTHSEVETLFHEFGHIIHQVLTRAPYGYLAGSAVAQDFVEAPSQMLENWVWDKPMLKLMSGHYKDLAKPLPDDLMDRLISTRDFNKGYFYSRQIMLGLTDMTYHTTQGRVDVLRQYQKIHRDVIGVPPVEGSKFVAGFGHLMGGYDAGYYGYIWSEVFAADMFTRFKAEGLLNERLGRSYRELILEAGSMADPEDLLQMFLGRKPNDRAFIKSLGI